MNSRKTYHGVKCHAALTYWVTWKKGVQENKMQKLMYSIKHSQGFLTLIRPLLILPLFNNEVLALNTLVDIFDIVGAGLEMCRSIVALGDVYVIFSTVINRLKEINNLDEPTKR